MKLILFLHSFSQAFRHMIVLSGFGTISYCKHSPTCSQYSLQVIENEGLVRGTLKGIWRVLRCW